MSAPDPSRILEVGMAFWPSKTLLSAVELGLFTELAEGPLTAEELSARLGLHPRAVPDFPDTLVALGFLEREGDGPGARYGNTEETAFFLNRHAPTYIGGILEMANARLYPFWGDLTEALRSGMPQNEIKHTGRPFFEALYADQSRLRQFLAGMSAVQRGNFAALLEKVDLSGAGTLVDVGGADGTLAVMAAARHPHLTCTTADLPAVRPIARDHIEAAGLSERVDAVELDFFEDPLPRGDVITMGNILHDWNEEKKRHLIAAAYEALPPGGRFIAIENVIDDARRENAFGLMMSLNMLIELGDGFDYTGADFDGWCRDAGFARTEIIPLVGPASAAVAYRA